MPYSIQGMPIRTNRVGREIRQRIKQPLHMRQTCQRDRLSTDEWAEQCSYMGVEILTEARHTPPPAPPEEVVTPTAISA